ncbi:MAG: hypothetical protein HYU99_12035 [Deltaproteobacteria bacterium]|nr:hypothetical protein [Deltaproteobacteria bacterium]
MQEYVTTNVRLEKSLLKALKLKALEEEKSMGAVLRELVVRGLGLGKSPASLRKKKRKNTGENPFAEIAGLFESGVPDGGVNHDEALYGLSKK